MKTKSLCFLLVSLFLFTALSCGQSSKGKVFLGHWQSKEIANGKKLGINISKNGDNYLIEVGPEGFAVAIPGNYTLTKEGALSQIGGGNSLTYNENNKEL
ncbi:MAG: hypothetical protein NTW31_06605, partial [Bacteroidetes bacterium]|nr:hypothetical protein [Bacteroidota bacterium]